MMHRHYSRFGHRSLRAQVFVERHYRSRLLSVLPMATASRLLSDLSTVYRAYAHSVRVV